MRVGFDLSHVADPPLSGVGVFARSLVCALASNHRDIDCRVVAMSGRASRDQLAPLTEAGASLRVLPIPTRLRIAAWRHLQMPPLEWLTGAIDIAFGGFHFAPPSRSALRVALIYDVAWRRFPGINTPKTLALAEQVLAHSVKIADAFVAISECTRADFAAFYGVDPARIHVVPGGIDPHEFESPFDPEAHAALTRRLGIDGPYFIYLGNLEPRKNLPRLLEAYARLRTARADAPRLVLVGAPAWLSSPVFETIDRLGLHQQVLSTGYLPRAEALLLLRGALACTYVSLYEGFGLPALEAMAGGTPVLAANVSSIPEVTGDTALLVDPYTVESIEAGLASLLDDPTATAARAGRALARARTMTWQASASTLATTFERIREAGR